MRLQACRPIGNDPRGLRESGICDDDGYLLQFGQGLPGDAATDPKE